jgi:threonyl-tRNA synthetase
LPGFEVIGWAAVFAPAGTPADAVAKLNRAMNAALVLPDVRERLLANGIETMPGTPEELERFVRAELDTSTDTLNKKVRNAVTEKIPNVLVVGEREQQDGTVTLRRYGEPRQETMAFAAFEARLHAAIATRSRGLPT